MPNTRLSNRLLLGFEGKKDFPTLASMLEKFSQVAAIPVTQLTEV